MSMYSTMLTDYRWWDISMHKPNFWLELSHFMYMNPQEVVYTDPMYYGVRRKNNGWYRDWTTFGMGNFLTFSLWDYHCKQMNDPYYFKQTLSRFYPDQLDDIFSGEKDDGDQ